MKAEALSPLSGEQSDAPVQGTAPSLTSLKGADIRISGLCKHFGQQGPVLENVELTIPKGQAVALIGHNGSGKSTLLRCCLQLIPITSGEIRILGRNIASCSSSQLRKLRSQVGFVFQRHNLVPRLSVLTNVIHGVQARHKGPRTWLHSLAHQRHRMEAMYQLERVGLAHLAQRRVDQLSGGESQRVAIARALMQQPRVMMADEPVASLDPGAGEEVMQLFLNLIRDEGITLLFVSHNLEHALYYADRIVGLRKGCLQLDIPARNADIEGLKTLYA